MVEPFNTMAWPGEYRGGFSQDVSGRALDFATHRGSISVRPVKEVVTVEVACSHRLTRDVHRTEAKPTPKTPRWEALNVHCAARVSGASKTMS